MRRGRTNRRKSEPLKIKLPRVRIDLRWFVLPPAAIAVLATLFVGVQAALDMPVERLELRGVFQRVTPLQVEATVAEVLDRGFLAVDLHRIRRRVERLDWVDSAEVARRWPDTLSVEIVEQQAAARWGAARLLNVRGELFSNAARFNLPELPVLAGPPGSEQAVAERYLLLRGRLATANLDLAGLSMDDRGAWSIELASGQQIRLGKQNVAERLERFFSIVLPAMSSEFHRVSYVDLRYTNGFAVAWLEEIEISSATISEVLGSG